MEDALARFGQFAGRQRLLVLILVVMEDALARAAISLCSLYYAVLILVVMEDALALYRRSRGIRLSCRS